MQNLLSPARWPSLAQDLAIMNAPSSPITDLSQIFSAYDIDEPTLCRLLTTPKFQVMVKTAMQDMRALGNKAAHVYRSQTLAQALSEHLYTQAISGAIEAKEALKLLELLLKSSGLMNEGKEATVNVQTNVGVNLPVPQGLSNPKLDHLKVVEGATDV